MNQFKRVLSLVLAVVLLLSCVYTGAGAVQAASLDTYVASCTAYPANLSVKTTEVTALMTYPCTTATESASSARTTIAKDTMLTASALYKNTAGEYWYKVLYYGLTLYVDATKTTMVDHLTGDVTVANLKSPVSLAYGDSFGIKGDISSSLNKLGTITASLYTSSNITKAPYMSVSDEANGYSYSLYGSTIDANFLFGNVAAGVYTYTVTAEAISYYIDDSDALTSSSQIVVLDSQQCVVTDWTNPNEDLAFGIDVSVWNGDIDWASAKNDIDYAILRIGFSTTMDNKFLNNANGCESNNIPYGVYHFSYAETVAEAVAEAEFVVNSLRSYGYTPDLPVWFDMEDDCQAALSTAAREAICSAFCEVVEEAGYEAGLYGFTTWFTADFLKTIPVWIAQIDGFSSNGTATYDGGTWQWQYSWEGSISGISGDVDCNRYYAELPGFTSDTSYLADCTYYPAHAMGVTNDSVNLREYPYTGYTSHGLLPAETQVEITGLYRNDAGEYWYQANVDGTYGYLYATYIDIDEFLYDDLAVIDPTMASNLSVGSGYYLKGDVVSQYNNLYTTYAKVYSGEDTLATPVLSSSDTNNSKFYDLYGSKVCSNMIFSDLTAGYYTYEISADVRNYYVNNGALANKTENVVVWTAPFTVGSSSITPPPSACTHANKVSVPAKAATCTTDGNTAGSYCSSCGMIITASNVIPATGHKYSATNVAGNCQQHPHTKYTCSACGDTYYTFSDSITSDWQTTIPNVDSSLIETKTQYRYSDYETTTSYSTSLSGYTQIGSQWVQSGTGSVQYVNSWPSGFSTGNSLYSQYNKKSSKVTASETTTDKTAINSDKVAGYLYYHWCYTDSYYSLSSKSGSYTTFHAYYDTTDPDNFTCDTSDMSYKTSHSCCSNSNWFFVAEVYEQKYTTYKNLFTYERWTDYSAWSDTVYTPSETRKVESRTMYRYVTAELGEHNYVNGVCSICGAADPNAKKEYYLFGYINGADYACEADYENLGIYKFTDGKLVASFSSDSYVAVKTSDNLNWYMTNGWLGTDVTSATLYESKTLSNADKLFVPGGVEITFTLAENADGTLTLSYTKPVEEVVIPTITPKYPSLSFEGEVFYNVYFAVSNIGNLTTDDFGLLTWSAAPADGTIENATNVIPGSKISGNYYCVRSQGIPAKNLADTLYFKVYAKLSDGTYVYSGLYNYSAKAYTVDRLANSTNAKLKSLCVAMLNYGAAAQTHFAYKAYNLMNASLTAEEKALVSAYSADMIAALGAVDSSKNGTLSAYSGYSKRYPSVTFEGAFGISYYFTPSNTMDGDLNLYYWTAADYINATTLSPNNATGKLTMEAAGTGAYKATVSGIAAKEIDSTIYVVGIYFSGGTMHCTGVLPYSLGAYCQDRIANGGDTMKAFATATAVYGYYAKQYFLT